MSVSRVNQPGSQPVQSSETTGAKRAGRSGSAAEPRKADRASGTPVESGARAEISARAREFAKAKEAASSAPDVREERVAELKRRIASGTYEVDADAVADRMIKDHALF